MVVRQYRANSTRHVEIREAFILLNARGYTNETQKLYDVLIRDLEKLSDRALLDDFQRTLILVDPKIKQNDNLLYSYHWTVSKKLEERSVSSLKHALKLAGQQ